LVLLAATVQLCKKKRFDALAIEEIRTGQWSIEKLRKTVRLLVLPTKVAGMQLIV
jgi:hypothetical protein